MPKRRRKAKGGPRRVIVLHLADEHAGNTLGLMNPETVLYEQDETGTFVPYTPPLSPLQKILWPWFVADVQAVADLADGDETIVVYQGDLVQGNKHASLRVGNGSQANQILIAIANQVPVLSLPNVRQALFLAGTAAHDGIGAAAVVQVVAQLRALYQDVEFQVLYHGDLDVDGCRLDCAHHGPSAGGRKWLEGNTLLWYLRDIVLKEWTENDPPRVAPRALFRAHVHEYRHAIHCTELGGVEYQFDAVLLPSWCGMQDYARKVTRSAMAQRFGMIATEIVGGKLVKLHRFIHRLDLRTEVIL